MNFKKNHYYKVDCEYDISYKIKDDIIVKYIGYNKLVDGYLFQILNKGFIGHTGKSYFKIINKPVPTDDNYWYISPLALTIKKEMTKEEILAVLL